jgi:hypothetical protein
VRVSIVVKEVDEHSSRTYRLFDALGHLCHLYVEGQPSEPRVSGTVASPAVFLEEECERDAVLFLFRFVDEAYPLLETMKHFRKGFVVLDLRGATRHERAPVHYADLCIVESMAQKRELKERTGCSAERISVLPDGPSFEEDWKMTISDAMQGIPPQTVRTDIEPMMVLPTADELGSILLIRDAGLDQSAILDRVHQAMERRQACGGYGPDVTQLGPPTLRSRAVEGDALDEAYTYLLRIQSVLDDLATKSRLREPDFRSAVPWVGWLIVAVRRFWNWMSAKWYVRGWMDQQAAFNARTVDAVEDLLRIQRSNEERIHQLELELDRLRREIWDSP